MIALGHGLATIDYAVIAAYALVVIALGLYAGRKQASGADFFLASRESTWPVVGLSLLASNISSATLIGLAGAAYISGIAVYNYEWMATVILIFFCIFFLPFILRAQIYTMPEFLERRYSRAIRVYFSALTIFLSVFVDKAATLYGGALMLTLIVPNVPLWVTVIVSRRAGGRLHDRRRPEGGALHRGGAGDHPARRIGGGAGKLRVRQGRRLAQRRRAR